VPIRSDADIIQVRLKGRAMASRLGFSATDLVLITTAISELARNIVLYAHDGVITLACTNGGDPEGIMVIAEDGGPGIADVDLAMQSGFSTSGSLGLGLPGVRRLMDDVTIRSNPGEGTTVVAKKWKR
jgi:serine/threonine-protein kinase RsbT